MSRRNGIGRRRLAWALLAATAAAAGNLAAQQPDPRDLQLQLQQRLLQQQAQQLQQLQQQIQQMQQQPQQGPVTDGSDGLSIDYMECRKQADGLDARRRCIQREQRVQQQRLDRAYDRLRDRLTGSDRSRLMDAQYTWQQSNAEAAQLDKALGGRSQEADVRSAEATLRRIGARANELEGYARGGR